MDINQAKKNWAYAQKALAEIHPSFKLHQGMPYERLLVGFKEDVNPLNMFAEYFGRAIQALGEKFSAICFDFYNLEDFYARNLSFDLTQVARDKKRPITIKDREKRLDILVADGVNTPLMGVTNREVGYIHERYTDHYEVVFSKEIIREFKPEKMLEIGAECRGQRIAIDTRGSSSDIFVYDHPADIELSDPPDPALIADMEKTFSEKPGEGQ